MGQTAAQAPQETQPVSAKALLDRLILNVPSAGHADDAGRADAPANLEAPAHAN